MLRVGLTGGLGSGKSTVARLLADHGATVVSADELGRELMQSGQPVYAAILQRFGPTVRLPSGELDRPALARLAFAEGRADELNAIVHPAVIARQAALAADLATHTPDAIFVVESALLLETPHAGPEGWRTRFDQILLVTAPEAIRIARFLARTLPREANTDQMEAARQDATRRIARQLPESTARTLVDQVLSNAGSLADLRVTVDACWASLLVQARARS